MSKSLIKVMSAAKSLQKTDNTMVQEENVNENSRHAAFADLTEDLIVLIASFAVHKLPKTIARLKRINKYWYECLDPNKLDVNMIWEKNICRKVFKYTPNNLRMKRWDRYFQYKWHNVKVDNNGIRPKYISSMYKVFRVIEGCDYDIEGINSYHFSTNATDGKKVGFFKDVIDPKSGLPKGFKWKLKCQVVGTKLEYRSGDKYYCNVCKQNVFYVETIKQLKEVVNNGQCARYFVKETMSFTSGGIGA